MRSGREETESLLRWARLRLAARPNNVIESWLPREFVPEVRLFDELRAEPREKLEERCDAELESGSSIEDNE